MQNEQLWSNRPGSRSWCSARTCPVSFSCSVLGHCGVFLSTKESIHCGCIPVILSDEYEVAFQHIVAARLVGPLWCIVARGAFWGTGTGTCLVWGSAWTKEWHHFSLKLPESMVGPELYAFLQSIPVEVLREMKVDTDHVVLQFTSLFGWIMLCMVLCQSLTPKQLHRGVPECLQPSELISQAEVDAHSCWFNYFSRDPRCSPFAAVLAALEDRKARRPSWSRFWHAPLETSWKRLTRFHSLANDSFMLGWLEYRIIMDHWWRWMEMDGNGGTNLGTWGRLDDLWCVLEWLRRSLASVLQQSLG